MPVLINANSSLAEDVPEQQAQELLNSGSHHLPMNDPQGNPVTAPLEQFGDLVSQGYTQPHPEQLQMLLDHAKNENPMEKAKAFAEGAAEAGTFGISTGAEVAFGADPQDISRRRETGYHTAGQLAGLAGSALIPGMGEANILKAAGEGAVEAIGLGAAETGLAKIGSSAVRNAVEGAIFTSGDEVSKMLASDPNQSAETALLDIGVGGLLGGGAIGAAFGSVSPLWKATQETKVGQFLKKITDNINAPGEVGLETPAGESVSSLIDKIGVDVAPEIKASLSSNPELRSSWQHLMESTTKSGEHAQSAYQNFRSTMNDALVKGLGKTPEAVDALADMSEHDAGVELRDKLLKELKDKFEPITDRLDKFKNDFGGIDIPKPSGNSLALLDPSARGAEDYLGSLSNKINELALKEDWNRFSGPAKEIVDYVNKELPQVKTIKDLTSIQKAIRDKAHAEQRWDVAKKINSIIEEHQDDILSRVVGEKGPEMLAEFNKARSEYGPVRGLLNELNDRLHAGSFGGPSTFAYALKDMKPEDVLRRLTPKNDAGLLSVLSEQFPETTASIKDAYVNQLLKGMSQKARGNDIVNASGLFKALDKWSPELRGFALPDSAKESLPAIRKLMESLPDKMNYSGTAKTLDSLWSKVPAGAMATLSWLTGHNPLIGGAIGQLGKYLGRDVPDAIKLAMLRYMGSEKHISGAGFKSMVDFIQSTIKGESLLNRGTSALFQAGRDVLPAHLGPSEPQRKKLDKQIKNVNDDPESMLNVAQDTNHYLPDHGSALTGAASRVVSYLNSVKPTSEKMSPLDAPMPVSKDQQAAYNRVLDIANQPLVVLGKIKDGTLIPSDVQALENMYPSLYGRMVQKMTEKVIAHTADGKMIDHKLRMPLSIFMAQALDSTMLPASIMSAQDVFNVAAQPMVPGSGSRGHRGGSMKSLGKMNPIYNTPGQSLEMRKSRI